MTVFFPYFRPDILDSVQKSIEQDKKNQSPNFQQQIPKANEKSLNPSEVQNVNSVNQHVSTQQILSPNHNLAQPGTSKDDSIDKSIKVANSTTITLIENGNLNSEKDKDNNFGKNYITLEPKLDKKDDNGKNSITITKAVPKKSPGNSQSEKPKNHHKSTKRPLQYLETLAEKAGITFDDKYEAANTLLALDKQNNANRRSIELKQNILEHDNSNPTEEYRYRNQKEQDDKLQQVNFYTNLTSFFSLII